jgi:hypothetical protein
MKGMITMAEWEKHYSELSMENWTEYRIMVTLPAIEDRELMMTKEVVKITVLWKTIEP